MFSEQSSVWNESGKNEPPRDKTNKVCVRPAKTQISLGIRPVWSESSLSAWRKLGPLATHWAHSEDSDQIGWIPRLIWVFAGRTATLLVLSRGGSDVYWHQHLSAWCTPPCLQILFRIVMMAFLFNLRWTYTIWSFLTTFGHLTGEKTEMNFNRILVIVARYVHTLSLNIIIMTIRCNTQRMLIL